MLIVGSDGDALEADGLAAAPTGLTRLVLKVCRVRTGQIVKRLASEAGSAIVRSNTFLCADITRLLRVGRWPTFFVFWALFSRIFPVKPLVQFPVKAEY